MSKFKIGDKVRTFKSEFGWRKPWIGKIGIIIGPLYRYDWLIRYNDSVNTTICWMEEDLELVINKGEQLLFSFMGDNNE